MVWPFSSTKTIEGIDKEIEVLKTEKNKLITDTEQPDDEQQDSDPQITIEIFGSEDDNSKGFFINDYKINTNNLDKTFSANDQVKYFFTNLVGAIENNNLSDDNPDKKDKKNFFHSYTETMKVEPSSKPEPAAGAAAGAEPAKPAAAAGAGGGKKKKGSRKRKSKSKHRKTKKH